MELASFLYFHWGHSLHTKCECVRIKWGGGDMLSELFSELSTGAVRAHLSSAGPLGDDHDGDSGSVDRLLCALER